MIFQQFLFFSVQIQIHDFSIVFCIASVGGVKLCCSLATIVVQQSLACFCCHSRSNPLQITAKCLKQIFLLIAQRRPAICESFAFIFCVIHSFWQSKLCCLANFLLLKNLANRSLFKVAPEASMKKIPKYFGGPLFQFGHKQTLNNTLFGQKRINFFFVSLIVLLFLL